MKTIKSPKNRGGRAARLREELRFAGKQRVSGARVLAPKATSWDALVGSLEKFPPDVHE